MMRYGRTLALVLGLGCLLTVGSCTTYVFLSAHDQEQIQTREKKKLYYLKYSFFVGPLYTYDDKLYISERGFDERVLVQDTSDNPIFPPEPTGVIPMGTQVQVLQIEFPTRGVASDRKLKSPRFFTWVYLEKAGESAAQPWILVLAPEFRTLGQFDDALTEYLQKEDPRPAFASLPAEELAAIDQKSILKGMRADSLRRARGHPDRITRSFEGGIKVERWQYAEKRFVTLRDDQVESWEGFPNIPAPSAPAPAPAAPAATPTPAPAAT
jgi:hypothetical protein